MRWPSSWLWGPAWGVDQHAVALDAVQRLAAGDLQLVDGAQLVVGLQPGPERAVHVQRQVGVLAGVLRRPGDVHLRERDLVRALAAQLLVADAATPQVAFGQAGQAVRLVHLQHIALQHGVVRIALHLDAVVGKHMAVVLDVLAQLGPLRVFQPGLQARQHLVERQLLRCVRAGRGAAGCRRPRPGVTLKDIPTIWRASRPARWFRCRARPASAASTRASQVSKASQVRIVSYVQRARPPTSPGPDRRTDPCLRPAARRPGLRARDRRGMRPIAAQRPGQPLEAEFLIKITQTQRVLVIDSYRIKSRQAADPVVRSHNRS
jgi:hypothetical protein